MRSILQFGILLLSTGLASTDASYADDGAAHDDSASGVCTNGNVEAHSCSRINRLSHISTLDFGAGSLSDVWGWTDPQDGSEYVIVGHFNGTSFVDISNPSDPVIKGYLPAHEDLVAVASKSCTGSVVNGKSTVIGHDDDDGGDGCGHEEGSAWRDIKVFDNHAYIVSESGGHGLQVFDLTRLRASQNNVSFGEDAHFGGFGNAHNLAINEQTAMAYPVGTGRYSGGLLFIDISNPVMPVELGGFSGDGYTHDAQCVVYAGPDSAYLGREICFACNEDSVTIVDVSNKNSAQIIARGTYANSHYVHQGWLSEDQRYFYQNDELDEQSTGGRTRTLIWDMTDLDQPRMVKEHLGAISSIDHNNYTLGEYLFQSNYTTGLRVLSTKDPLELIEIAHFDTFPGGDSANFDGTWSNYPYFPSGTIAVSDKSEGLFLLEPAFMHSQLNEADLNVALSAPATLSTGSGNVAFEYTATITNNSVVSLEDVVATHILPPGAAYDSIESDALCTQRRNFMDCRYASIAPNGSASTKTTVFIAEAASVTFEVHASAMNSDPVHSNNKAAGTATFMTTTAGMVNRGASGGGGATGILTLLLLFSGLAVRVHH